MTTPDLSNSDTMDDLMGRISDVRLWFRNGDGAEIDFDFNYVRISVSVFPPEHDGPHCCEQVDDDAAEEQQQQPIEAYIIDCIRAAGSTHFDDEIKQLTDEVLHTILDAGGKHLFPAAAPASLERLDRTMNDLVFGTSAAFRLVGLPADNTARLVPIPFREAYTPLVCPGDEDDAYDAAADDPCLDAALPRYSTEDLVVAERLRSSGQRPAHIAATARVDAGDGVPMLCKARVSLRPVSFAENNRDVARELGCLHAIRAATAGNNNNGQQQQRMIRVPALMGYVLEPSIGYPIGLVRQWIPGQTLKALMARHWDPPSAARKAKWLAQMRETLDNLHGLGIVWGDGRASNVVIDEKKDDAWLVDFGGARTRGWFDQETPNTVVGDELALEKIAEFLGLSRI